MSGVNWKRFDDTFWSCDYRGWTLRVDARWTGWQWIIERVGIVGEKTRVGGIEETLREAQNAAIAEVDRRMGRE